MEVTNVAIQTVNAGSVVTFDSTAVRPRCCMSFREGSGTIILKGGNQRRRYLVTFEGNVSLPATDGTPVANAAFDSARLAIAIDGEPVESSTMISTPAFLGTFNNISTSIYIDVDCGCCLGVSVENTTGAPVEVANVNLSAVRVA